MLRRNLIVLIVVGSVTGFCEAAPQIIMGRDANNTVPGTVAYALLADGDGDDWTVGGFKLDLTAGSVYNSTPDSNTPLASIWPLFPEFEWDTWFGVPGNSTNGIAGGTGDLGGGPLNIGGTGTDAISITWFNTDTTNTGLTRIANITLSDDAEGAWRMEAYFGDSGRLFFEGTVAELNALPIVLPEPASLVLLGVGGLVLWRRR